MKIRFPVSLISNDSALNHFRLYNGFRGRAIFVSLVHYTGTSTAVPTHTLARAHILFDRHSVLYIPLVSRNFLFFSILFSNVY